MSIRLAAGEEEKGSWARGPRDYMRGGRPEEAEEAVGVGCKGCCVLDQVHYWGSCGAAICQKGELWVARASRPGCWPSIISRNCLAHSSARQSMEKRQSGDGAQGRARETTGRTRQSTVELAGERQQYRRRGRGAAGSMLVGAAPVAWWEGGCPSYQTVLRAVLRTVLRTVLRMVLSCPSYCPASCPVLSDCPGGVPGGAAGADWAREPQHTAPSSDAWSEGGHPMLPGAGWGVQTLRLGRIGEWAMGLAARRLHGQARGGSPRVITHYSAVQ